MWNGIASVEVSPGSPYAAARPDGTASQAHTDETLNVGQSGHTSDSERDLAAVHSSLGPLSVLKRLENEGGNPFHARQHRRGGVEQRPVTEIPVGTGHQGGPLRL